MKTNIQKWTSVAMSANGQHIVLSEYNGGIYKSSEYGTQWSIELPPDKWNSVNISKNALTYLAAAGEESNIDGCITGDKINASQSFKKQCSLVTSPSQINNLQSWVDMNDTGSMSFGPNINNITQISGLKSWVDMNDTGSMSFGQNINNIRQLSNLIAWVDMNDTGTLLTEDPIPPSLLYTSNVSESSFTANWSTVFGATNYFIDVSTNSSFSSFVSTYNNKSVNATSDLITGLSPNTFYYFRIRSFRNSITSSNSLIFAQLTSPAIPINLASSNIQNTSFNLTWNSVSGASGYYVDLSFNNDFTNIVSEYNNKQINTNNTSFVNLTRNTNYFTRVRSFNSGGSSNNSNILQITTDNSTSIFSTLTWDFNDVITFDLNPPITENFEFRPVMTLWKNNYGTLESLNISGGRNVLSPAPSGKVIQPWGDRRIGSLTLPTTDISPQITAGFDLVTHSFALPSHETLSPPLQFWTVTNINSDTVRYRYLFNTDQTNPQINIDLDYDPLCIPSGDDPSYDWPIGFGGSSIFDWPVPECENRESLVYSGLNASNCPVFSCITIPPSLEDCPGECGGSADVTTIDLYAIGLGFKSTSYGFPNSSSVVPDSFGCYYTTGSPVRIFNGIMINMASLSAACDDCLSVDGCGTLHYKAGGRVLIPGKTLSECGLRQGLWQLIAYWCPNKCAQAFGAKKTKSFPVNFWIY